MAFASDYIDVAARIAEFRAKHPEGSLQPFEPWRVVEVAGATFIVYTAAAYRAPDDPRPGVGTAWEPFPGLTNFTRNSELQNAETSAWGRAIIAVGAADAKKGVASAEDVRNRQAEQDVDPGPRYVSVQNAERIRDACDEAGVNVKVVVAAATNNRTMDPAELFTSEIPAARDALAELASAPAGGKAPQGASVGTDGAGSDIPAEPAPAEDDPRHGDPTKRNKVKS